MMDPKRRKTQDSAEKDDSIGSLFVMECMELNAEAGKPHFLTGKSKLPCSSATNPEVMEKGKSTQHAFLEQQGPRRQWSQQNRRHQSQYRKVKELNRKKDFVCLILSYPPMNLVNKERHKNWVQDVMKIGHEIRERKVFSSKNNSVPDSKLLFKIDSLLDHLLTDIEAYVPALIIKKMCGINLQVGMPVEAVDIGPLYLKATKQEVKMTAALTRHGEKLLNLAVDFAIRQILEEIENPEVPRIMISGRDGIRVMAAMKALTQIEKMFDIVIQVDASLFSDITDIEKNIAAHLGFSNILEFNKSLENTNFLIVLNDIHGRMNLFEVGIRLQNSSKNIQKIVCMTRSQKVHQRMAMDLEIRLEDHLLSWQLFCMNVGKNVHSSGFQHRAIDVVEKCSGHLLAVVLMARALKMVPDVIIWERASCILGLPHRAQMKDRVLCNALAFILGRLGSADECVKYSAFHTEREGIGKIDLIQEWIRHALIKTVDEGEKIVQDLINAFVFESFQNGYSVRMRDDIREVLLDLFRLEVNTHFLSLGGRGLTKAPNDEAWEEAYEIHLMNNKLSELPKSPNCPHLCTLFLQNNSCLRVIPPLFFQCMPMLQILDLSHTKIRSLPPSLYGLVQLQRLVLRGCKLFMELPPDVGKLSNLKVLDLEGTEIIRLPVDIGKLTNLTCLKISIYGDDHNRKDNHSNVMIPQNVISNLFQLEELIIDVNPNDKRWNAGVKDIVKEVCSLDRLEALQLYLPEVAFLNELQDASLINLSRMHFRFTVGNHLKRIISPLPLEVALKFDVQERCLKFVKGEDVPTEIEEVLPHVTALFLDRHSTATSLSEFGIENMENLKLCVLGECNEIQTIVDADDDGDVILGSLEYLNLHYMKNLRSIWKGPLGSGSLSSLKALTLYSCPQLTTIFTLKLVGNLYNLEELVVEDCPEIVSIVVTHDPIATQQMWWARNLFRNLKKMSLHYLPKLVSISNGLLISPKIEWMSFFDCPSLKTLSTEEGCSNDLKVIIGQAEWWRELKWNNSEWFKPPSLDAIFVPIEWDTDLITRLAEINDQLQARMQETKPSQQSE